MMKIRRNGRKSHKRFSSILIEREEKLLSTLNTTVIPSLLLARCEGYRLEREMIVIMENLF